METKAAAKERPILFSGEMVRAILDGRKTQTRRAVKPKRGCPIEFVGGVGMENDPTCWGFESDDGEQWALQGDDECQQIPCPYGQPGDRLWVRESHAIVPRTAYAMSDGVDQRLRPEDNHDAAIYREGWVRSTGGFKWRPSIHMPRWASRILLEVVSVRVERLNDISEADAGSEGAHVLSFPNVDDQRTNRDRFRALWDCINGAGSWDQNPWVWVVEFKRIGQQEKDA